MREILKLRIMTNHGAMKYTRMPPDLDISRKHDIMRHERSIPYRNIRT